MKSIRSAITAKEVASRALRAWQKHGPQCPCHSCQGMAASGFAAARGLLSQASNASDIPDYAFELAASNIRFGLGVTREIGMDLKHLGAKRAAVYTDPNLKDSTAVEKVLTSLEHNAVHYDLYDQVVVEPKLWGMEAAVEWARARQPDAFVAVGGGSVIDTTKVAGLMQAYPNHRILDFVNAPVGKALPITRKLRPLLAVPTTAGTGSETTGTAIFDLPDIKAKVGISSRSLKPLLGIVDPENAEMMPAAVRAASGLDVLCHSMESYTAIPYNERTPRPTDPILRPAYQGANPISDIFSMAALRMIVKYLPRSVRDTSDHEAVHQCLLAATLAGIGFGNAGVHLCHGLSYPISAQNQGYVHLGYESVGHPIIPHGVSVAVTAPAVFEFTAASCPERHLELAEVFGADVTRARKEDAGRILGDALRKFLHEDLAPSAQPRGIKSLGFKDADIPQLVSGALPQRRVMTLEKSIHGASESIISDALTSILEKSVSY